MRSQGIILDLELHVSTFEGNPRRQGPEHCQIKTDLLAKGLKRRKCPYRFYSMKKRKINEQSPRILLRHKSGCAASTSKSYHGFCSQKKALTSQLWIILIELAMRSFTRSSEQPFKTNKVFASPILCRPFVTLVYFTVQRLHVSAIPNAWNIDNRTVERCFVTSS